MVIFMLVQLTVIYWFNHTGSAILVAMVLMLTVKRLVLGNFWGKF